MRILSVSAMQKWGSGQIVQLKAEFQASQSINNTKGIEWVSLAFTTRKTELSDIGIEKVVPRFFKSRVLFHLYEWRQICKKANQYDAILVRSNVVDLPSLFFARRCKSLFTVHHAKEVEELEAVTSGILRMILTFWESKVQPLAYLKLKGVIGVTDEISSYERRRFRQVKHSFTMPNGIDTSDAKPLLDDRVDERPQVIFLSSFFYPWQGLDLLVTELDNYARQHPDMIPSLPIFNIVGEIDRGTSRQIHKLNSLGLDVKVHGHQTSTQVEEILARCSVGITSLALYRQGLSEACALKVREYLLSGIPVYGTYTETGLSGDFLYYYKDDELNIGNLLMFTSEMTATSRQDVRNASINLIDKKRIMLEGIQELQSILG